MLGTDQGPGGSGPSSQGPSGGAARVSVSSQRVDTAEANPRYRTEMTCKSGGRTDRSEQAAGRGPGRAIRPPGFLLGGRGEGL